MNMNVIDFAVEMADARLAALRVQAQKPTIEQYKAVTRAAVEAVEVFTHYEKSGLVGEIEDAWKRLEAGNAHL